jgi:hypothetical protein
MSATTTRLLSTADLPDALRVEPAAFAVRQAARSAGLSLARSACTCSTPRADCPECLTRTLEALRAL